MSMLKVIGLFVMVIALAACSARSSNFAVAPDKPLVEPFQDPGDEILKEHIAGFLEQTQSPLHSQYEFSRLDLDADGRRDALVLLKTPYGYWCGIHGCTLLVMKAHNKSFSLVNTIQPIRTPVHVSELRTNGWRNLITRVSGRNTDPKNVALQFNGNGYPHNPDGLPPYMQLAQNEPGVKLFP